MVHIEACPTKGSAEFNSVRGAMVDVFVQADSLSNAALMAVDYLMNLKWTVKEELSVLKMTPELIRKLDKPGREAYAAAKSEGLGSFFAAWPVQDRTDNVVEVRTVRDKGGSNSTEH